MVYRGTAQRAISTTRPSMQAEEEEMKAKASAANRVLQSTQAATIPSPMPTGDAAPTAAAAQRGLVNTGPANTAGIQGYGTGVAARKSGAITSPIGATVAAGALPVSAAEDTSTMKRPPRAEVTSFNPDLPSTDHGGNVTTGTGENVGLDNRTRAEIMNSMINGGAGQGGEEEIKEKTFREMLEENLMGKLNETPEERAQMEAGRALVAARAQAGRGQMGMSGGMLALQSDVMGDAAAKAEDRLFNQQLSVGRIGTQLEALDKAEKLGLLDYMESADFESEAQASAFLRDYLNMDDESARAAMEVAGVSGRIAPQDNSALAQSASREYDSPAEIPTNYIRFHEDDGYIYYRDSDSGDVVKTRKVRA